MGDNESETMDEQRGDAGPQSVDTSSLTEVLQDHPVEFAVLFGSQVTGTADERSDVDIAVGFEPHVEDQKEAYMALLSAISSALDRNDLDLSLLDDLPARVGRSALEDGIVLVGPDEMAEQLRAGFEADVSEGPSRATLRKRFDATLANVDELFDSEA